MDFGKVYNVIFQLWLDEIAIAEHNKVSLDIGAYKRMLLVFSENINIPPPSLEIFSPLADDALVMMDVGAVIHSDDLGEYTDIDQKRKEMMHTAHSGIPFLSKSRHIHLISHEVKLSHLNQVFRDVDATATTANDDDMIIIGRCTNCDCANSVLH